jgi:hypothetical protein
MLFQKITSQAASSSIREGNFRYSVSSLITPWHVGGLYKIYWKKIDTPCSHWLIPIAERSWNVHLNVRPTNDNWSPDDNCRLPSRMLVLFMKRILAQLRPASKPSFGKGCSFVGITILWQSLDLIYVPGEKQKPKASPNFQCDSGFLLHYLRLLNLYRRSDSSFGSRTYS